MLGRGRVEASHRRRQYVVATGLSHRSHRARPVVLSPHVLVALGSVRDGGDLVGQRLVNLSPEAALTHMVKCLRGVPIVLREVGGQCLVVGQFVGGIVARHLDFLGTHKRFQLGFCHAIDAVAVD